MYLPHLLYIIVSVRMSKETLKSHSSKEEHCCGEQRHSQVPGPVVSGTFDTLWVVGIDRRRGTILTMSTQLTSSMSIFTYCCIKLWWVSRYKIQRGMPLKVERTGTQYSFCLILVQCHAESIQHSHFNSSSCLVAGDNVMYTVSTPTSVKLRIVYCPCRAVEVHRSIFIQPRSCSRQHNKESYTHKHPHCSSM